MDQLIRLKKFKLWSAAASLFGCMIWIMPTQARGAAPMVTIRTVGVIPLQTKHLGSAKDLVASGKYCLEAFPIAVRDAKRFLVLDNDFIASMWSSPETRKDLVEDYELDAFVSLDIQLKNDTVIWYARLLSPRMETYLIESETMSRATFSELNQATASERIQELVFRTFNRLPVDATITSLQTKFATLSAGAEQGINKGDTFSVIRPSVSTTHPATGAWLSFSSTTLGKIKIIEVKENSSIGEVTHMTHDNSMMIGDGIKVSDLNSRLRFKRRNAQSSTGATDLRPQSATPIYAAESQNSFAENKLAESGTVIGPVSEAGAQPLPHSEPEMVETSSGELTKLMREFIDYGSASAGFRLWNASGAATAQAAFFPVNFGQIELGRKFGTDSAIEAGGYFSVGSTKNGSYGGFGGYGRISYQIPLSSDFNCFVGGGGGLNSLAVDDEPFGGYDVIYAAGFGALVGQVDISEQSFFWRADLEIRPFNVGQVGAKGNKRQIESSLVTVFRLNLFQDLGPDRLEWGGGVESTTGNFSLDNGDLTLSEMSFNGSARIRF